MKQSLVRWERNLRTATGLVLGAFVCMHLFNHSLGLISVQIMDAFRQNVASIVWQNLPATVLLYGSLLAHLFLTLGVVYRRSSLRMPAWELIRLGLGIAVPLLLIAHVAATRGSRELFGFDADYPFVITVLWSDNWLLIKQTLLLFVVWVHFVIGMHYWLRIQSWYSRWVPVLYAIAVLLPVVSWVGFISAARELTAAVAADPNTIQGIFAGWYKLAAADRQLLAAIGDNGPWVVGAAIALTLLLRQVRVWRASRQTSLKLHHPLAGIVDLPLGATILEALRQSSIAHASVCGGRARCTTCRVRVFSETALPAPSEVEANALVRIGSPPNVRLACQLRPTSDLHITPLLPVDVVSTAIKVHAGGVSGHEQKVVAMFIDLRGSTKMGESKLPYDVVFILNQFFAQMSQALEETNGHYAQFAGDGLLGLYGLKTDIQHGCCDAIRGAQRMVSKLEHLNQRLASELPEPLRIGIGIHAGDAIVGTMGPPSSPLLSAIGDNINIAARLESQTKVYGSVLVLSAAVGRYANVDLTPFPAYDAEVRGRNESIRVHAVADPRTIPLH